MVRGRDDVRILLYEFVTGGGLYSLDPADCAPASLLREGRVMRDALASDFLRIPDVAVDILVDGRFGEPHRRPPTSVPYSQRNISHQVDSAAAERYTLGKLAAVADWSVLIAPEFDDHLLDRCRWVERAGGRLLGPSAELVALAGDKQATCEHLARAGVRVPRGRQWNAGESWPAEVGFPAVLKPRSGAGSQGVRLIEDAAAWRPPPTGSWRIEEYRPGLAASVSFLTGPNRIVGLPACRQRLSNDGHFAYLGGALPLEPHLARRASALAALALATLPAGRGYLGVDLVLGADANGTDDCVIEINPRLTTSYVGLRAATDDNLAAAMLEVDAGGRPTLCFYKQPLQFAADGRIERRVGD